MHTAVMLSWMGPLFLGCQVQIFEKPILLLVMPSTNAGWKEVLSFEWIFLIVDRVK